MGILWFNPKANDEFFQYSTKRDDLKSKEKRKACQKKLSWPQKMYEQAQSTLNLVSHRLQRLIRLTVSSYRTGTVADG